LVMTTAHTRIDARLESSRGDAAGRCPQTPNRFSDISSQQKAENRTEQTNAEQTQIRMRAHGFRHRHDQSWRLLKCQVVFAAAWALDQSHRDSLARAHG